MFGQNGFIQVTVQPGGLAGPPAPLLAAWYIFQQTVPVDLLSRNFYFFCIHLHAIHH